MLDKIKDMINYFRNRFLLKMIVSYSLIIILMLAALTFILSRSYSEDLRQREIDYEDQIIKRVADYSDGYMDTARNIIRQIYSSQNSKNDFLSFLKGTDTDDITLDNFSKRNRFNSMFESALSSSNNILDIIIVKSAINEVLHFRNGSRLITRDFDFKQYEWFEKAFDHIGILRKVPSYIPKYIVNDTRPVFTAYAGFIDSNNKFLGVILINFDAHGIQKSYAQYHDKVKGSILVMDDNGSVYFDSTSSYYGERYPYFDLLKDTGKYVKLESESIVALNKTQNGLTVAGIVPKYQIMEGINLVVRTIYLIMLACIFISIILIYLLSRHFSQRVKSIMKAMKDVEKGILKKRIPPGKGNDEIEQININFNRMCERLESYIEKVYLAEIKAKDAQLAALQTQINPHFLYNTLESIRMKAIVSNAEEVSEMIYMLANLFKRSVKTKDMVIRIRDEINYCKSYLELNRIRLGERLKVVFDIKEDIMNHAILKLMLQPLIENSLEYSGINDSFNAMTITIRGYNENGTIYLSVEDNGSGIDENKLEILKKDLKEVTGIDNERDIGLRNINDRIKIMFGDKYGLDAESVRNSKTTITLRVPAMKVEEARKIVQGYNR